jgi:hypothetical protein
MATFKHKGSQEPYKGTPMNEKYLNGCFNNPKLTKTLYSQ